ncbi:hypothetical protein [uncultured Ferrimonas sp.]|uniref:hypothetical protein n=1 Tax=uncultured Ferrimonas sp. TaxID=432640 RepID=UPI0026033697|nr:hypothetical protein [uncultured Ferrimonas sp.]
MYSDDDLSAAVDAGVIAPQQAEQLRQFWQQRHQDTAVDAEHFRLVTGFNDIFVVIASMLLLVGVQDLTNGVFPGMGGVALAAASWLLSLYFVLNKRMALPAIVLLVAFVYGIYVSVEQLSTFLSSANRSVPAGIAAALAAWLHWRTFKVPITIAAAAVSLVVGVATSLIAAFPEALWSLNVICLLAGLGLFALALYWDFSDPARISGRADVAFWLHLVASPLIVHPIFFATGALDSGIGVSQSLIIFGLYLLLALVSLVIDRRAMMVSALVYVISAFAALLSQNGFVDQGITVTGLVVGLGLIALSVGWHRIRKLVVSQLPTSMQQRLPRLI